MYPELINFINDHHVLTLCTCVDTHALLCQHVLCICGEYKFFLIFTSYRKTKHIQDALVNNKVAGSILLETEAVGKYRVLQFQGEIIEIKVK